MVGCTAEQEQASDCPESSRLGLATVETLYGHGEGVIYLTSDFRLFIPFRAYGPLYEQAISGRIHGLDNGMAEIVFDNLPPMQVLQARFALDGGARSIFITPRRCGAYTAGAKFVSHNGTVVETSFPLNISGCAEPIAISGARVAPTRVRAGRRPTLVWQLSARG